MKQMRLPLDWDRHPIMETARPINTNGLRALVQNIQTQQPNEVIATSVQECADDLTLVLQDWLSQNNLN